MAIGNLGGGWIRGYGREPGAGSMRLFCFPHAGGSASYFYPWSALLSPGIEVMAVQYPGRQDRRGERCITSIPDLADRIHDAVQPLLDRPYAFFGHSMGAILAFEVARRIARGKGRAAAHLFASGRRAPSRRRHENTHRGGAAAVLAELRSVGGTDQRVLDDEELLSIVLPVVRADYEAIETYLYEPGPPLTCPLTAMVGDRDPKATVDEAAAWAEHTTGGFDLRVYPGGHFYLDECRAGVLDVISASLAGPGARRPLSESRRG